MKQGIYKIFNFLWVILLKLILFLDIESLQSLLKQLEVRVGTLENNKAAPAKSEKKETPKKNKDDDDDDVDLFGSESEVSIII